MLVKHNDIPYSRGLRVNPLSAWVESNLDTLIDLYYPGIIEIELQSGKNRKDYVCQLYLFYDKKGGYMFPSQIDEYDTKIKEYAYQYGIEEIYTDQKVVGDKIEVRVDFYVAKNNYEFFSKGVKKDSKEARYKYSWEMAKGGDIPITRALGVNPVSAWVEINLDALVKMYIPGIQEIEIRGKTIDSEYTCQLSFLYDKKEEVWLFPNAKYNDDKIKDYAYADGINISSISPHKVFNGEKIEVRIVFYADKIDFDKRKPMAPKRTYKYSWEMAEGGALDNPIITFVNSNIDRIKEIYSKYDIIDVVASDTYADEEDDEIYGANIYIFFDRKKFPKFDKLAEEDDALELLLANNKIYKKNISAPKTDVFPDIYRYYTHRFNVEMSKDDAEMLKTLETPKRTYKYSWEMKKGGMTRRRYDDGGGVPYKNLSLEKPQVIMDSSVDTPTKKIAELEIVKTKNITIPAINTSGQITSSSDSAKLFRAIWDTDQMNIAEHFNVILLNRANKPIGFYQHSKGGIDGTIADVEMICGLAVKSLSRGVIVAHNHPSGNLQPSQSDLIITRQLRDALALFKINLLDSMILVPNSMQYYSMLDEGNL